MPQLNTYIGNALISAHLSVCNGIEDGLLDPIGMTIETHVLQHHNAAEQQSRRIRQSFPRDIRCRSVNRLEDGAFVANVSRRCETQTANQTGAHVRQDIAIQIRHDQHLVIVRGRIGHDLETCIVEQLRIKLDVREILADIARSPQEQTIAHLHDGRFVHRPDLGLADLLGVLKCETKDSLAGGSRDELDALHHTIDDDVLDARVLPLRVLPDQSQVDVVV